MPASRRIGAVIDLVMTYGRGVLDGVLAYALEQGNWDCELPAIWTFPGRGVGEWRHWDVDGVVVQLATEEMLAAALAKDIPVVNVSSLLQPASLPTVRTDNEAVGRMQAEHLMGLGLRRLAFYGFDAGYHFGRARGFVQAVAESGRRCAYRGPEMPDLREHVDPFADLRTWLAGVQTPVGIAAVNDTAAADVLRVCRAMRVAIPEQVAVVGVDDEPLIHRTLQPSLSSVQLQPEQIGREAARILDGLMNGEPPPAAPILMPPTGIVRRASTDMLAIDDPELVEALRFIREHAREPITIDDVLARLSLSRRSLERRFREAIGRSPRAEIERVRMERARELLAETDLPVPRVAQLAGFGDPWRFGATFKRLHGATPTAYRRRFRTPRPHDPRPR